MPTVEDAKKSMDEALEAIRREFATVRTSKATPALLDTVRVDAYGSKMPINQLATINTPEPTLLVVQPYDQGALAAIEKAIRISDLGLSPVSDGKILRVPIPPLTEERRKEFVKQARKEGEKHRVSARNHRRDSIDMLEALESEKEITEDDQRRGVEKVEEITKEYIHKIDEILKAKEDEVMAV